MKTQTLRWHPSDGQDPGWFKVLFLRINDPQERVRPIELGICGAKGKFYLWEREGISKLPQGATVEEWADAHIYFQLNHLIERLSESFD